MMPGDLSEDYRTRQILEDLFDKKRQEVKGLRDLITSSSSLTIEATGTLTALVDHIDKNMLKTVYASYGEINDRLDFIKKYRMFLVRPHTLQAELDFLQEKNIVGFAGYTSRDFYTRLTERKIILEANQFLEGLSRDELSEKESSKKNIITALLNYLKTRREKGSNFLGKVKSIWYGTEDIAEREKWVYSLLNHIVNDRWQHVQAVLVEDEIAQFKGTLTQNLYNLLFTYRNELAEDPALTMPSIPKNR